MNEDMNKQKPVIKVKGAVWRVKVGIHSPSFEVLNKGHREIKNWSVSAYLN